MALSPKKQKVVDFLESVEWLFDMQNYSRDIAFYTKEKTEEGNVLADITTNHTYRTLNVNVYPRFFRVSKEEQAKCLIHELSHTITEDMHDDWHNMYKGTFVTEAEANHHRERATEQIAYLIFQL
jgi:hypothetical protein